MKKLRYKTLVVFFLFVSLNELSAQEIQSQLFSKNLGSNFSNVNGSAKLEGGIFFVELTEIQLKNYKNVKYNVILSSLESWSGLYVKEINEKGFVVKSESGDLNAKFFWQITPITNTEEKQ